MKLLQSASQTVGPFFHYGLVFGGEDILLTPQTKGERITLKGNVIDGDGEALPDALVEIWQADAEGKFNHPSDPEHVNADKTFRGFGRSATQGGFSFRTIKPGVILGYTVPFMSVRVFARGMLIHAVTRIYFSDEDNSKDALFASVPQERQHTLIAKRADIPDGIVYYFDIILQGKDETVFFDL
jgi:protocatechuate 3,4-dioxygenase, alpha subunit